MAADKPQEAMDALQSWIEHYIRRAHPTVPLASGGEAGGAQLRLKYNPSEDTIAILHFVAVTRDGRPAIEARSFEGSTAETSVAAGLWASGRLGRRPS